jgi:PleD family two-component response regulator
VRGIKRVSGKRLCRYIARPIGISEYTADVDINDWINEADSALYEAKQSGRNKTICYQNNKSAPIGLV